MGRKNKYNPRKRLYDNAIVMSLSDIAYGSVDRAEELQGQEGKAI